MGPVEQHEAGHVSRRAVRVALGAAQGGPVPQLRPHQGERGVELRQNHQAVLDLLFLSYECLREMTHSFLAALPSDPALLTLVDPWQTIS